MSATSALREWVTEHLDADSEDRYGRTCDERGCAMCNASSTEEAIAVAVEHYIEDGWQPYPGWAEEVGLA